MTEPWTPPTSTQPGAPSAWGNPNQPEPQWGPPASAPAGPRSRRSRLVGVVVVPVVAVAVFLLIRVVGGSPPAPVEVDTRMAIAAPFVMGQTNTQLERQMRASIEGQPGSAAVRDLGVREVLRDGELVGFLVILDVGLRGDPGEFMTGFEGAAPAQGATAVRRTFDGRPTSFLTGPGGAIAMWTAEPLAYVVIALDVESTERLIRAVVAAAPAA